MSTPKTCLVIDIECTCWNDGSGPPYANSEIIEIGITPVSLPGKVIGESESIIVLPKTSEISPFCTQLTTLTPKFVADNGIPFSDAIEILKTKYKVHRNMWASWGEYDKNKFREQCGREAIRYPFNNIHLNVKSMFAWKFGFNGPLNKCCDHLGLEFKGTAHRGVDDSRMISKALLAL